MTGVNVTGEGPRSGRAGIEGGEGTGFRPVDLPAPEGAVGAAPRALGGARGAAHRWQVMANPTWVVIAGERVVEVAVACLLVPRPTPDDSGLWMIPTALASPMLLAAEKRFGIAVEFVDPPAGVTQGLEVVTNHLGGGALCAVVPEDAPEAVRDGVARQRITAQGRPCPCGAVTVVNADTKTTATIHYPDCPGQDCALRAAVAAWLGV